MRAQRGSSGYRRRQQCPPYCSVGCIFMVVFMVSFWFVMVAVVLPAYASGDGLGIAQQYLYNIMEPSEYYPVIEYVAPKKNVTTSTEMENKQGNESQGLWNILFGSESDLLEPDFLLKAEGSVHRIVEFYAPWCPHCRNFKSHYIDFARQMSQLVKDKFGTRIDFHAISCTANKKVCSQNKIRAYPTLRLYPAESVNFTDLKYYDLNPRKILKELGIIQPGDKIDFSSTEFRDIGVNKKKLRESTLKKQKELEEKMKLRTKQDIYHDAYLSFLFSMKNGIFMEDGPLSRQSKSILFHWLQLLQYALPSKSSLWDQTHQIQDVIQDMLIHFDTITNNEDQFMALLKKYTPNAETWSLGCTKGEKGMGYTCGLWQLFHIMTLGVVEWNASIVHATNTGNQNENHIEEYLYLRTLDAADILKNFVQHFFGCEVCRTNFVEEYDTCQFRRCQRLSNETIGTKDNWIQLPLWLYELHNGVNVRLLKERALRDKRATPTKRKIIDVQFPTNEQCPMCWADSNKTKYDEGEIYNHLREVYWDDKSEDTTSNHITAIQEAYKNAGPSKNLFLNIMRYKREEYKLLLNKESDQIYDPVVANNVFSAAKEKQSGGSQLYYDENVAVFSSGVVQVVPFVIMMLFCTTVLVALFRQKKRKLCLSICGRRGTHKNN